MVRWVRSWLDKVSTRTIKWVALSFHNLVWGRATGQSISLLVVELVWRTDLCDVDLQEKVGRISEAIFSVKSHRSITPCRPLCSILSRYPQTLHSLLLKIPVLVEMSYIKAIEAAHLKSSELCFCKDSSFRHFSICYPFFTFKKKLVTPILMLLNAK